MPNRRGSTDFHRSSCSVAIGALDGRAAWSTRGSCASRSALANRDWRTAIERYQEAFQYPKNLEVAARTPDFKAHLNWALGSAYVAAGHRSEARAAFEAVLAEKYAQPALGTYYQALVLRELGSRSEATSRLAQLEERARALVASSSARGGRGGAVGEYLMSLVLSARLRSSSSATRSRSSWRFWASRISGAA